MTEQAPLLSICIPTYNRARWIRRSLAAWMPQVRAAEGLVELVVSDNCSTDETPEVIREALQHGEFRYNRNSSNIEGGPNMQKLASELARGEFVWLMGDDDIPYHDVVERILNILRTHPEIDYVYANYSFLRVAEVDINKVGQAAMEAHCPPVGDDLRVRFVPQLKELVGINMNCFTPIYCSIMRRPMAAEAFKYSTDEAFSTVRSVAAHAVYIAHNLFNRPAFYMGQPCLMVSDDGSWPEYLPIYYLTILPKIYDLFLEAGADSGAVQKLRKAWITDAGVPIWQMMSGQHVMLRERLSLWRFFFRYRRYPKLWGIFADLGLRYLVNRLPPSQIARIKKLRRTLRSRSG